MGNLVYNFLYSRPKKTIEYKIISGVARLLVILRKPSTCIHEGDWNEETRSIVGKITGEYESSEMLNGRFKLHRQMNLEYLAIDSQGFVTNNDSALEILYGDEEDSRKGVACLNQMAARVATVFASLREFPFVRY